MASTDARPVPIKNAAYRHYFAIRDNAGALVTTWAGQDTELSLDGAAFGDATNEATEIGTSGVGYLELTAAEMDYDAVVVKVTVTNANAVPYVVTLFPEEAGDIRAYLSDAALQDIAQIVERTDGTVWYVSPRGDDANSGLTPDQAQESPKTTVEAASAGDVVILTPGVCRIENAVIRVPTSVKMAGSGMDVSIVASSAANDDLGAIISPGTSSSIEDLTVTGLNSYVQGLQSAFGARTDGQPVFTGAVIRRCRGTVNGVACLLYKDAACSWTLVDSIFTGNNGALYHQLGGDDTTAIRCQFEAAGLGANARAVEILSGGSTFTATDCDFSASGGSLGNYALDISSTATLYGCRLYAAGTGAAAAYANGGTITLVGCEYDRTLVTLAGDGTVTDVARVVTNTSGQASSNVLAIDDHTLSGTGTQIADGFEAFFNVPTPTFSSGTALSSFMATGFAIPGSPMTLTADAIDTLQITAAAANKLADHVRRRQQANVEASSDGDALDTSSQYGAIQQMQNSVIVAGTMTIKKTDNATLGTKTVSSTEGADPITGIS